MKSEYREGETLGSLILKTQEEHEKSDPIRSMDLAHEGGKSYMKELLSVVENHADMTDEYYIQVFATKERMIARPTIIFTFAARKTAPPMHVEQDLWYVNNELQKLELLWSLPRAESLKFMKEDPDTDKQLKAWIELYLRP